MRKLPVSEELFRLMTKKSKKGYVLVRKALEQNIPNKVMVVEVSNGKHWYANPEILFPHVE